MKTRKLVIWQSVINLISIIIIGVMGVLCYNKILNIGFVLIPFLVWSMVILIQSTILSVQIKDKYWYMAYDELIKAKKEADEEWDKAVGFTRILGEHEAIKLHKEKYPERYVENTNGTTSSKS